jgi:Na+-translocating ferredoxin:NAD+ oxidoreductase RnfD subunit
VTRRWVPWRPRLREVDSNSTFDVDLGDGILVGLVLGIVIASLAPFILPFLFVGIEAVIILLVLPAAVLGRVLLGKAWTVEVRRGWSPYAEEKTGTWNDASIRINELAAQIERGDLPAQNLGSAGASEDAP